MALPASGYWGASTATNDFCEPNYTMSHYVAEFWNTLSSVPIVAVGAVGLVHCRRQKLGAAQAASYGVVGVVGVGSILFHATLMRTGQVLDEVPMLWAVVCLLFAAVSAERERRTSRGMDQTGVGRRHAALRIGLAAYTLAATALYFYSGFVGFIVAYAASVVALVLLAAFQMFAPSGPQSAAPRRMLILAAATYAGGFLLLWLPGEVLCHHVPLFQRLPLHALFHLTSAAGPHLGLTAFALAQHELEQPRAPSTPLFAGLPAIDRRAAAIDKAA